MSIHRSRNALITDYIPNNHVLEHVQENPHLGVIISENHCGDATGSFVVTIDESGCPALYVLYVLL
jgi:hypothetical protein